LHQSGREGHACAARLGVSAWGFCCLVQASLDSVVACVC
jgi:hypothetical protein